jgi:hypothetical protein
MPVSRLCSVCGNTFLTFPSRIAAGHAKYCSRMCADSINAAVTRRCQNPLCHKSFRASAYQLRQGWGKFCSTACSSQRRTEPFLVWFWKNINRCAHDHTCLYCCWEWQGPKQYQGYGRFRIKQNGVWQFTSAHRLAWELLNKRPFPDSLQGLHYCSNPPCANPLHIYPGTPKDNMRDALKLGRLHGRRHARGEELGHAKLKTHDIPLIFHMRAQGMSQGRIAKHFHVSQSTIHYVLKRKRWNHVQP